MVRVQTTRPKDRSGSAGALERIRLADRSGRVAVSASKVIIRSAVHRALAASAFLKTMLE